MNAIQATGGGGRVQISVQTQLPPADRQETQSAEYTTIQVRDRGQGISRDDLENIFTPFFTTKKAGRGTGLGLSIAQGIVEEHGGWIDVESRPGQGTCFTVWLPREEAACTEAS
jgi:signal transduction histidine kinase